MHIEQSNFIFVCKSNTMFSATAEILFRYELAKVFPMEVLNTISVKSGGTIKIFGKERSGMHKLFKTVLTRNNIPWAEDFQSQLIDDKWFKVDPESFTATYVYALDTSSFDKIEKKEVAGKVNKFIEDRMFDDEKSNELTEEDVIKIINEIGTRILQLVEGLKKIYGKK